MAFTPVTITGTATDPSSVVVKKAVVAFVPDEGITNTGVDASAVSVIAGTNGTFSIDVDATDDSGTTTTLGNAGYYTVVITDPRTGESIEHFRCPVPSATTPTTLTALKALAV